MYLHIKASDNDFSFPLQEALEEFWQYMNDNNKTSYLCPIEDRWKNDDIAQADLFVSLHTAGQLKPMLIRMWVLRTLLREVETMTRHIDDKGVSAYNKTECMTMSNPIEDTYSSYLEDFEIEFCDSMDEEWNNGEDGWLDLNNGEVTLQ